MTDIEKGVQNFFFKKEIGRPMSNKTCYVIYGWN